MNCNLFLMAILVMQTLTASGQTANLQAVDGKAVSIDGDSFWGTRLQVNRQHTLPHNLKMCQETGRLENFKTAAGQQGGPFKGTYYNDSDVYKVLEGAARCLGNHPDAALDAEVDALIAQIAAAQQPDGYLYTFYTVNGKLAERWTKEQDMHETYCAGHLIEAAVAHFRATGKRSLLDVAIKLADHIDSVFGKEKKHDAPGHEEIELALVKLFEVTQEPRYLKLAAFFLEQRGHRDGRASHGEYDQDHLPVRQQREIVGHAVRAMYLYSGMIDVSRAAGDATLLEPMDALWHDVVDRKMYITGGVGPSAKNEGFTHPYDLPNESAYCETCASIGMAMWNQRLALLHGDAKYADVVEREIYNGILAGVSLDGEKFFYVNPLASRRTHHRQGWFACACCPPNLLRFIASIADLAYAKGADGAIYINQYIPGQAKIGDLTIRQETNYPWEETVLLTIRPKSTKKFTLHLRVPGWCESAEVAVNGRQASPAMQQGYLLLDREWKTGDTVELNLPMPVRRVHADPRGAADVGRVALMRGPIVYCQEAIDNPQRLDSVLLPADAQLAAAHRTDLLGGVTIIKGSARQVTSSDPAQDRAVEFTSIPYFAWDNRDAGQMSVWIAEDRALAAP
jgi:DUF1680 family protein